MKPAILFPGQGSQHIKMGIDFYENDELYKSIIDDYFTLHPSLKLIWNGDEEGIDQTLNAQKIIFSNQYAMMEVIKSRYDIKDVSYAGFSLGEYQAYLQAGVFDFKLCDQIITKRSELMEQVKSDYVIKVTLGLTMSSLNYAINYLKEVFDIKVLISNYNLEKQILVAIKPEDEEQIKKTFQEHGMKRMMDLKLSGPFHTSEFDEASASFYEYMETIEFKEPISTIYLNLSGDKYVDENLKIVLKDHMTNGVLWYLEIIKMIEGGIDTFIEVGSKSVLSAMVKKIDKSVNIITVEKYDDLDKLEVVWNKK